MRIGRKHAIATLVAGLVPWIGRKAFGQEASPAQIPPASPAAGTTMSAEEMSATIKDLQKRVGSLESSLSAQATQLANLVGFTKDASGNLTLRGTGSVTLTATSDLTLKAGGQGTLQSTSTLTVKGSAINLN